VVAGIIVNVPCQIGLGGLPVVRVPLKSDPLLRKVIYKGTQAPLRKYAPKPALTCKDGTLEGVIDDADTSLGKSEKMIARSSASERAKGNREATPPQSDHEGVPLLWTRRLLGSEFVKCTRFAPSGCYVLD
jgi:hypothetical protein